MQRHGARGAHRRAVSRGRTEWRTFLETRAAAHRELLILACPRHLPRELLGLEVAHDPRRHAQHERPGRHDEARGDEARGANKSLLLHHRVVHDDRADADEHAAAYGAPVKDRPVADVRVLLELRAALLSDRKSTRLNSSHVEISYAVFCLKKKKTNTPT